MGQVIISGGGGGGITSDEVTVTKDKVLSGYTYVGSDTDDEIGTGTMPTKAATTYYATTADQTIASGQYLNGDQKISKLSQTNLSAANIKTGIPVKVNNGKADVYSVTGTFTSDATATAAYIYSGKTAYVNGSKITGTMTVSSISSFSAAVYSTTQITLTWKNPAQASGRPFSGVHIRYSTSSAPTSTSSGTSIYTGTGSSTTMSGTSSVIVTMPSKGTKYYFSIWAYATTSLGKIYSPSYKTANATTTASGRKAFTSSGTFTIPSGVRTINIHAVGGGGSGHNGRGSSSYYKAAGGGGGGGGSTYQKGIAVTPGNIVTYTIGAGGTDHYPNSTSEEKTGGDTVVTINNTAGTSITAEGGYTDYSDTGSGGSGGASGTLGSKGGAGGSGADFESGSIDDSTAGGNGGYEFGDSSATRYQGGGGGGGGSRYISGSETTYKFTGKSGGSRGGGRGADTGGLATSGSTGTGGGGGGGCFPSYSNNDIGTGGDGGSGCVIITW